MNIVKPKTITTDYLEDNSLTWAHRGILSFLLFQATEGSTDEIHRGYKPTANRGSVYNMTRALIRRGYLRQIRCSQHGKLVGSLWAVACRPGEFNTEEMERAAAEAGYKLLSTRNITKKGEN